MTDLTPNFWLPSNVLSDEDEENGALLTSQEVAWLNDSSGSSPSCSQREKATEAWDLSDAAAFKFKVNEVNWNKDFQGEWSCGNNIDVNEVKGNAFATSNSTNHAENSTVLSKQFLREKPCPVLSGWWKQTKPMQGHSTRISEQSYPPWISVQGGGSGMKAVFLESNGSSRESGGTGVFLPRRAGDVFDSKKKKKSCCSTVLLPYRVVQALNLTIQNMKSQPSVRGLDILKHGSIYARKIDNNKPLSHEGRSQQQKRDFHPINSNTQALPPDIILPQDWTY